jgi:hypothetical protein
VKLITVAAAPTTPRRAARRRERLERDLHRQRRVDVVDEADRVLAAERDLLPRAATVERARGRRAAARDAQREALLERRFGRHRTRIVEAAAVAPRGVGGQVEEVPEPELPVAAEVELAAAEPPIGRPT